MTVNTINPISSSGAASPTNVLHFLQLVALGCQQSSKQSMNQNIHTYHELDFTSITCSKVSLWVKCWPSSWDMKMPVLIQNFHKSKLYISPASQRSMLIPKHSRCMQQYHMQALVYTYEHIHLYMLKSVLQNFACSAHIAHDA